MEAAAASSTTASQTIAHLIANSAVEHADHVAVRYKRDGDWHDVTYTQLADTVQEIALGLIELGLQPGERICILANTRPEWSYVDMAATSAGLVVVPIYQTNSPEECLWVISDSDACAIVVRGRRAARQDRAIREQLPNLRTIVTIDEPGGEQSTARARPSTRSRRPRSSRCASSDARARPRSSKRAARASARRTRSRSSTPPAPPARRRAAC